MADPLPAASVPFTQIDEVVREEIEAGDLPGAVVVVGRNGQVAFQKAYGAAALVPRPRRMRMNAIFDLASLTKVFTATAIMQLVESGRLKLDAPVASYWPEFGQNGKDEITVRQLLTHTSGLRQDLEPSPASTGESDALRQIAADRTLNRPGSKFLYSDVGFIVLGELVRRVSYEPLDTYVRDHIFLPLGMRDTGYRPAASLKPRIVPADVENGVLRWGEVQDPTAFRMGGVAGHAGLFSTAADLTKFARMLLGHGSLNGVNVLKPESVDEMLTAAPLPGGVRHALGWDGSSPYSVGIDVHFGPRSVGHTGYTGTMLWIDPASGDFLILLTSRLHPDAKGDARPLRQAIARIVGPATQMPVLAGIDVLAAENFVPLEDKRIALLTNAAARDRNGQRTIDVLAHAPGVHLVSLFTPEHGLSADREGKIESGRDETTGLPITSLYGASRHPTDEMLAHLDAIVIDLQDAGVRYFTYPTTVDYVLEAAAKRGIEVFVLDRPDPIDAGIVQGPVLDPSLSSFTGYFPVPVREGMTLGELATMFNAERNIGAKLTVIAMQNYGRHMWFDETGLDWANPSPNLRSVVEATLYPGVGMIEGANVSVGRGTASPFEVVGAPWIDGRRLARYLQRRRIAGVRFARARFQPDSDRYAGETCDGVRISLTDRTRLDAAALGLELAAALHRLFPDRFAIDATRELIGSPPVFDALKSGQDPRALVALWMPDLDKFRALRAKYLLYTY